MLIWPQKGAAMAPHPEILKPQNIFSPCRRRAIRRRRRRGMVWISGGSFCDGFRSIIIRKKRRHTGFRSTVSGSTPIPSPTPNSTGSCVRPGYVTAAEKPPRAEDYPGAIAEMLRAGSIVFQNRLARSIHPTSTTGGTMSSAPTGAILWDRIAG